MIPKAGTREHEQFLLRARDPNSLEAKVVKQMMDDSTTQAQGTVRQMLFDMISLAKSEVPGQLFRDIEAFHRKFELAPTEDHGHKIPDDLLRFRIKFMCEELQEYCNAVGAIDYADDFSLVIDTFDAEKAFDALIDLVYVALGTAYLHRFPFNEGWARVQEKNMQKVRAAHADDERSTRKHAADVVKPDGWTPPSHSDLLDEVCPNCRGKGYWLTEGVLDQSGQCGACGGSGRKKRAAA